MPDTNKIYDRQKYDTKGSWLAFCDYLSLENPRHVTKLHSRYIQENSSIKPPTKSYTTLAAWSARYNWTERAAAYDADQGALKVLEVSQRRRHAEAAEIERYVTLNRDAGVAGMQIVMQVKAAMAAYIKKNGIQINDLKDLGAAARIVSTLEMPSSELWARATGIDELMEMWTENNQKSKELPGAQDKD
jgi:hypothetical protein